MISKAKIKYIRGLYQRKYRDIDQVFIAEGPKIIEELKQTFTLVESYEGSDADSASMMNAPQGALAVFRMKEHKPSESVMRPDTLYLMLDDIQNPGNLGTIIRLADWFGIETIFCSNGCADIYNPKTVQATMGALARVNVIYGNLSQFIEQAPQGTEVYGTFLDGADIYTSNIQTSGIIIMGNEGHGISDTLRSKVTRKIKIPNYPEGRPSSESLNVAIATGIICSEFRRRALS